MYHKEVRVVKLFKRAMPILLSAAMAASMLLPAAAANQGSGETTTTATEGSYDKSIVMVDAGRKYFSVDSLKSIIDSASSAGMHYVMLGLGNDGMRFLLDDMSLTVGDTTYTSEEVSTAVHAGNEAYSDFEVDELTEDDMDAIMSHADSKGVEIIPLINTPGHMDAILDTAEALTGVDCAYGTSQRTIDITNETATSFTKAFLQKYITYFASKGCTLFNMGVDEYANDAGGMGFPKLVANGQYDDFIKYVNEVSAMVKEAGMTPMAFNDGIYYDNTTDQGTFDQDIIICYWSSGWWGYDVAKPAFLAEQGHQLVNTHGDWYWIVGGNKCTAEKASQFNINSFMSGTIEDPVGAMFCIWSDVPQAQTDASVAEEVADVIAAFGSALPETPERHVHGDASLNEYDKSFVMVDAGRKYFSVDSLKSIIDSASSAGMHYVMLGLGNDGMRFLLDDMTLTVGGTTYTDKQVSDAIHAGNEAYSDFEVDELTEAEMNEILSYAATKGVEIVPLINTPGHMDSILDAAEALTGVDCAYGTSQRTIDITNETATSFTKAFLQKYITYFASKGCTLFNMGVDEYANDAGGMGFPKLVANGQYDDFIKYVNEVSAMVKEAGMTPMAFNDGIYYDNTTDQGTFDQDIIICYWSSGWWGYDVAKPAFLAEQGHQLVNTHGDWYWIVGGNKCTAEKASQFNINSFMSGTIEDPVGAMFCIWSDVPQAQTDASVAEEVADVIAAFGSTLPETAERNVHPIIAGSKVLLQKTYDYALTLSTEGVTDTAKAAFETALANAKIVLDKENATQDEIDAAWDALLEGIWGLGLTQGDKTMLEQLIAKAESMIPDQDKYVQDNWQTLVDALAAAKDVMADGDAMQEDVDVATQALMDAILAQRFKADKSVLEELVNRATQMVENADKYVETHWQELLDALTGAQAIMADQTLSEDDQAKVDEAADALLDAILAQRFKADKSILDDLINKAEGIDLDGYTAESVATFRTALANAQAVMADNSLSEDDQATVDAAVAALSDAMNGLTAGGAPEATQKPENNVPQTGDSAQVMVYVVALAAAVCLLSGATVVARKNRG